VDHDEWPEPGGVRGTAGRLSRQDRRRQLIGIGLQLLTTRPIRELSIDEVAAQAGISRSLLFHYFPSKGDYYAAVVRAACRRLLRAVDVAADVPDGLRVRASVDGLVTFIERHREPYVALVRGAAGGDAWVQQIYEETRAALADRALDALRAAGTGGPPLDGPAVRTAVRGWLAYCEEVILEWTLAPVLDRDALVTMLTAALDALVALTPTPARDEGVSLKSRQSRRR
jgi:AcrR family transcriptional regulator